MKRRWYQANFIIVLLSQPASLGEGSYGCLCFLKQTKKAVYDKPNLAWFRFLVFQKSSFANNKNKIRILVRSGEVASGRWQSRATTWERPFLSSNAKVLDGATTNTKKPAVCLSQHSTELKGNFQIRFGIRKSYHQMSFYLFVEEYQYRSSVKSLSCLYTASCPKKGGRVEFH